MLFKSLALKNFKCFEEVEVEFAPITLLTGANSGGKSSLIYSLLAMLQTEQFPFYLSPNGKYVDMGSFKEMVYQGDVSEEIEIILESLFDNSLLDFYGDSEIISKWSFDHRNNLPVVSYFKTEINRGTYELIKNLSNKYLFNYQYRHLWGAQYYEKIQSAASLNSNIKKHLFSAENERLENVSIDVNLLSVKEGPFNSLQELKSCISTLGDFNCALDKPVSEYIEGCAEYMENLFNYIGSFRLSPERTYYQKAKAQEKVGVNGEGYIDQIIEWEETNPEKFEELNEIMADLELIQSIQSEKMKGGRFELTVKTKENSSSASLTDVGFGISQFLPLIVADLQLRDNSCLTLSQPEIHLHPKIQALFGNYLAKQINKSSKQYIVETHSEYLLNRIRLLLVKGELKPEEVRIYYFENDGIKSVVHNVEFTTDGQIVGAPDGFFDTYGLDVMDIALNA